MRSAFEFDIANTTRAKTPRVPFERIARVVLPKDYSLSLVIAGRTLTKRLNYERRKKTYEPNVLSFPLSKKEGEIFINPHVARREAKRGGISFESRIAHLFVHGCLHLLGHDHGAAMDAKEAKILKQFGPF